LPRVYKSKNISYNSTTGFGGRVIRSNLFIEILQEIQFGLRRAKYLYFSVLSFGQKRNSILLMRTFERD